MTILTFDKPVCLPKTHFRDLVELRAILFEDEEMGKTIDFRPLRKDEITPELRRKVAETKKLPANRFTNLTAIYANKFNK